MSHRFCPVDGAGSGQSATLRAQSRHLELWLCPHRILARPDPEDRQVRKMLYRGHVYGDGVVQARSVGTVFDHCIRARSKEMLTTRPPWGHFETNVAAIIHVATSKELLQKMGSKGRAVRRSL